MTASSTAFNLNPQFSATKLCGTNVPTFEYIGMTSEGLALPSFISVDVYTGYIKVSAAPKAGFTNITVTAYIPST